MPNAQRLLILTTLREEAGISLSDMARRFGLHGTQSRKTVGAWERGELTPRKRRRTAFLGYLWDDLRLRKAPEQFAALWNILVDEWGWEPISAAEWEQLTKAPLASAPIPQVPKAAAVGELPPLPNSVAIPQAAHLATWRDRNRCRMLEKVKLFWITGILEQSLHGATLLELGMTSQPELVERTWDLVVQQPHRSSHMLPPSHKIIDIFDELGAELLILGAPGSGKTTTLLELARSLIARAERDAAHPMPVVFNLASWAEKRWRLDEWLVDELSARYQVPRKIGADWVANDQILPLLDGLDEVMPDQHEACIAAINRFQGEHGLLGMVVCSRTADYQILTARLRLHGAIVLQPLTPAQIDAYLAGAGDQLASVRVVLREDSMLQELADTPLMLNIMALAYQGLPTAFVQAHASLERRRTLLFAAYVERMFQRRGMDTPYTSQQTLHWLGWLARKLAQRSQTVFYIEGMQPEWMLTPTQRSYYAAGVGAIIGLAGGLAWGIVSGLIIGLLLGLLVGLISGVTAGLLFGLAVSTSAFQRGSRRGLWWTLRNAVFVGASVGLGGGLAAELGFKLSNGLLYGLLAGLTSALVFGLIIGTIADPTRIAIVETTRWSWTKAQASVWQGILYGLIIGLMFGLAGRLIGGPGLELVGGLEAALTTMLGTIFTAGLTAGEVETRTMPNQGIRRSARNALCLALGWGLVAGLINGLVAGLVTTIILGPKSGLLAGVALTLVGGLGAGLAQGLLYGGFACVQHIVLRLVLYRSGMIPWNYADFLDCTVGRLFLRKVGGGYVFVHRLLLEHFATPMDRSDTPITAPQQPLVDGGNVRRTRNQPG
jgi:transcriptional regulator with XRE-family HTH domain